MAILDIKEVSKFYGQHQALNKVSLQLKEASIMGLLGPNGAGKTSLIRIINQITGPDEGEVLFRGKPLERAHVEHMGYLPEERGLYRKMQVGEQAIYLTRLKGYSRSEAVKMLKPWFEKFELNAWWDKKIEDLSKGMAQKVQFITTVVHEPDILILDEPFSGFDPINTELVRKEIHELKKKGTSIILSTHNMGSVEAICDEVTLINKSNVVLRGKVNELQERFFDKTYLIDCERITAEVAELNNWELWNNCVFYDVANDGKSFTCQLNSEITLNEFISQLVQKVQLKSVKPQIPSMNDIFIQTIRGGKNYE